MAPNTESLTQTFTIVNELGLHARAAAKIARMAQEAKGKVWLAMGNEKIDAKQVMDILTLAVAKGNQILVIIESPADAEILKRMAKLINKGFGE